MSFCRKSTFDMFSFLASQHRQLPDIGAYDEEEDEVPLKSTRSHLFLPVPQTSHLIFCILYCYNHSHK